MNGSSQLKNCSVQSFIKNFVAMALTKEEIIPRLKTLFIEDDVFVNVCSAPKYLQPFIAEPQIIFVYKKIETTDAMPFVRSVMNKSSESDSDFELTGHPLEAPFSSDEESSLVSLTKNREEDTHYPVNITDVRRAMSVMNLRFKLDLPLIALTNDGFEDRTIVLGSSKKDKWYRRFWIKVQDSTANAEKVSNVDEMIIKHNKLSLLNRYQTISEVTCQYVMEAAGDNHVTFLQESAGSLVFNLMWKTPSFHVPSDNVDVTVTINSSIGHDSSDIATLWNHLILLHDYLAIIRKWEHDRTTQGIYSRHSTEFPNIRKLNLDDTNSKSIQDRLLHLLREPNETSGGAIPTRMTANEKKTLEETVRKVNQEKKEEEFTDRLWSLLIECSSYEELYSCIEQVFQAIRNGTCKPYIKSTNITRLAYAIRCCRKDPNMFSAAFEPLELLIEIGIEKLKKEFLSIFLLAKIATAEQLIIPTLPKFPEILIANWMESCSHWVVWLLRLHISLQLMLLTENTIKFRGCLQPLTALALKHYCGPNSPIKNLVDPRSITSESFTTAIDSANINDLVNRKTPFNSWKLELYSESENRRVTSVYYRDMNDNFPSSVATTDNIETSGNNTYVLNAFPYHCYDFQCVSDRIA